MSILVNGANTVNQMDYAKKIVYSAIKNHLHRILWQSHGLLEMIFYHDKYCADQIKNVGLTVRIASIRSKLNYLALAKTNIAYIVVIKNYAISKNVRFALKNHVHRMKWIKHGLPIMNFHLDKYLFNPIKK
jgi:hypothetical protein